jgi:hypothetical protein
VKLLKPRKSSMSFPHLLFERLQYLAVVPGARSSTAVDQRLEGNNHRIIGRETMAKVVQLFDREPIDIVARQQTLLIDDSLDHVHGEPMEEGLLDEVKPRDVLLMEPEVATAAAPASRRLQNAAVQAQLYFFSAHAHGPSQLGKSERPRGHLFPPTIPPLSGRYTARGIVDQELSNLRDGRNEKGAEVAPTFGWPPVTNRWRSTLLAVP